jgi:hypothetical protein
MAIDSDHRSGWGTVLLAAYGVIPATAELNSPGHGHRLSWKVLKMSLKPARRRADLKKT